MTHIVAGNTAPEFSLKSLEQKEYSLRSLLERGPVVAAFFKISCPVCQFTFPFLERLHQRYGSSEAATFLGISQDDAASHRAFSEKYRLRVRLLSDVDRKVHDAYGAWGERPGRGVGVIRSTFLVGEDGRIARAWYFVKPDGHALEVLSALRPAA